MYNAAKTEIFLLKNGFEDQTRINNKSLNFTLITIWCIFTSNIHTMARQSISFTEPNDEWLKSQVASKEYSSKSELVNDLIRQARKQQAQIDWIKAKLD